ncbi:hypothetical protein [Amycolatopsis vancoresmycina]|uniref:Uncharacterized protein n=1 Tax=Amycolatopsis vancoresmycina DSM 44592 TaxID=1292037 RepID=R1G2S3_9PSEU|nr:hypothetical protein [Amycolatopsis vancoresmycina]EOD65767.1 hypothetical protein H480_24962 [Amycolatopsis vancoresmycina DSM 44592]
MTEPGRRGRPLLLWLLFGVFLAAAAGVVWVFTVVPARVQDKVTEPHVVGSEAPEIAARLEKLTPAERADDTSVRRAAAVEGAVANEITRDVSRMTVVAELLSPDPDHVCYAFTVLPPGTPVRYERLRSCP